jgi:hypothetical protein
VADSLGRAWIDANCNHNCTILIPCRRIVAAGSEGGATTLSTLFFLQVLTPLSLGVSRN